MTLIGLVGLWASSPAAHAATGELAAFGAANYPPAADQFWAPGPVALDPSDDNSLFVVDYDQDLHSHLRKFSKSGTQLASLIPTLTDPSGQLPYIVGVAVDSELHRLYALVDADVPDGGGTTHAQTALEIRVYSTTPSCPTPTTCTLVAPSAPAALTDGVLFDFRGAAANAVEFASGLAVDPDTNDVAVLGVNDVTVSNPTGVIQYVSSDGAATTRVSGLGAGLDPDPAAGTPVLNPAGLDIAPNGDVYVLTASGYTVPWASASVYRLPRGGGTPSLVVTDTNQPLAVPGATDLGAHFPNGSPIAVSADGQTFYLAEGDAGTARVRGFSTATGALKVSYGGGTTTCKLSVPGQGFGLSAGNGDDVATVVFDLGGAPDPPASVHLFGTGGTGCPRAAGVFSINGAAAGTVTVTKGQTVSFDAAASQLLGGTPSSVDWDFDNSGAFGTHPVGTPPPLTITKKFTAVDTYHVGLRIGVDGAPPTDPVFRDVKVIAPTPTASFKVSNRNPAPDAAVTFDAGDSVDPAGSPTAGPSNDLKTYRWDFGDGPAQETTAKTISHAFANTATAALVRTVKLTVVSHDDVASNPVSQTVTVTGRPADPGPGTKTTPTTPTPPPPPPPVLVPTPGLSAASVDSKGATVSVKISCPAGGANCVGKIELTVKVKKKVKGKTKVTTVKIGSATFSVNSGKSQNVSVKLSSTGKSLLKKQKRLSASAGISVTAGGKTGTTTKALTLKAPAAKRK